MEVDKDLKDVFVWRWVKALMYLCGDRSGGG